MRIPLKYETPVIKVIDIRLESFICESGTSGTNPIEEGENWS